MNLWRCLGISIFLLGTLCLLSTTKLPVHAGDKKSTPEAVKKSTVEAKKSTVEEKKSTVEEKKTEPVKPPEAKKEVKGGETLKLSVFDAGKKFYQVQKTTTKQKMTVMTQTIEQNQDQTFVIEWMSKGPDAKGNHQLVQKIVGVEMQINIGGNKISYDSRQQNPKNPMTDFFEQLKKSELTYVISPDLKVVDVLGRDEFIKGLSDINPQMQGLLKAILSKKALEKMAEPTWWAFPEGGKIAPGMTWTKTSDLDLGPIGNYKTKFDFTAKTPKDGKEVIGIKTTLEYSAPTEKQGLPFVIHEAKLKSESGEGEAVFDRAKGRFDSTKITMNLKGELTIEVGNMKTKVDLVQDQNAESNTYDTLPAAWEKKGG